MSLKNFKIRYSKGSQLPVFRWLTIQFEDDMNDFSKTCENERTSTGSNLITTNLIKASYKL